MLLEWLVGLTSEQKMRVSISVSTQVKLDAASTPRQVKLDVVELSHLFSIIVVLYNLLNRSQIIDLG